MSSEETPSFWTVPEGQEETPKGAGARFPFLYRTVRARSLQLPERYARLIDWAALVTIAGALLYYLRPDLILSTTTTTGGDTAAHVYGVWFAREELIPRVLASGWSHSWLGGAPMLHFYFPLVVGFQALISYVIPFEVAFKIGTVLGPLLLPVGAYSFFKQLGFTAPTPHFGAMAALGFLLMDSYTIYGGNLPSTLAGEYSFTVSLALSLFFLGMMYRIIAKGEGNPIAAAALLAAVVLSHVLPVLMLAPMVPLILYWGIREHGAKTTAIRASALGLLGFAFTAFWSLPMIARIHYTTSFNIPPITGWSLALPREIWITSAALLLTLALGILRGDRRVALLVTPGLVGLFLYHLAPAGLVWNGRWLPFWYLSTFLATAYLLGTMLPTVARSAWKRRASLLATGLTLAITLGFAGWAGWKHERSLISGWITHNYEGVENKPSYSKFLALQEVIQAQPEGRVTNEDSSAIAEFGSAFAFMSLPYWIDRRTLEGLYFESSLTTPYLMMLQTEMSEHGPHTIPGLPYKPFDLEVAAEHMRVLDVRYYIAVTETAREAADASEDFDLVERVENYSVYEVVDQPGTVFVPRFEPAIVDSDAWREVFVRWWAGMRDLDVPLVREGPPSWTRVPQAGALPREEIEEGGRSFQVELDTNEIRFETDAVGLPHWVKVSYFPNWRAEGAEGPYLASPSMMMVIPTEEEVVLRYGRTWAEWVGWILTLLGLAAIILPATRRRLLSVTVATRRSRRWQRVLRRRTAPR